jgi:hypothetical protein
MRCSLSLPPERQCDLLPRRSWAEKTNMRPPTPSCIHGTQPTFSRTWPSFHRFPIGFPLLSPAPPTHRCDPCSMYVYSWRNVVVRTTWGPTVHVYNNRNPRGLVTTCSRNGFDRCYRSYVIKHARRSKIIARFFFFFVDFYSFLMQNIAY